MTDNEFVLWEDDKFRIITLLNPHVTFSEGIQLIVIPKRHTANAWENPDLSAEAFLLATKATKILSDLDICPWFNLQANGNWGLLPGSSPTFHVHVYGRNRTESWGKPIILPALPETFENEPMPEEMRSQLTIELKAKL